MLALLLSLFPSGGHAAEIELAQDQFVIQEGGWAPVEIRKMRYPDPVGQAGECVVLIGEDFDKEHETKLGVCDEVFAEAAMTAAGSWDIDAGKRDYWDQQARFRAVFSFEPDSVGLLVDERWLTSDAKHLPDGVSTWKLQLLTQAVPKYPKSLIGSGEEAHCTVHVEVQRSGVPKVASVEGCEGAFEQSARQVMKKWRWAPPLTNGRRTTASTTVKLNFQPR